MRSVLALLAVILAAAAGWADPAPVPDSPAAAARFDYSPDPFPSSKHREVRFLTYDMYRVEMPSPVTTPVASNNRLYGFYYRPRVRTDAAVIVLPIANGRDLSLEQTVAVYLAHRGFKAFVMPMPYQQERGRDLGGGDVLKMDGGLEAFRDGLHQAVLDVKRVRQWLVEKEHVDPERVGLVGISLGSLVASVTYSVDPGFRAAALVLSGGDLAAVIWHDSKETNKIKAQLVAQGKDLAWTRATLRPMDPLTYATPERRRGVLMVNAKEDEVFPFACTRKLQEAYGHPRLLLLPGDHYSVAIFIPLVLEAVARHLRARLLGPIDEPASAPAPTPARAVEDL